MIQWFLSFVVLTRLVGCASFPRSLPPGFVYLSDIESSIQEDMRYASAHNFLGVPVKGYAKPKCILTQEAAIALAEVQLELSAKSMSLKVYDCFRPQRAVNHFVEWAKNLSDQKTKSEFYPYVDKANLFRDGYIAEHSGHSRGSTVDLTIASLDFGTEFDYFDPTANTDNPKVSVEAKKNRALLKSVMEKHGFKNLKEEWWHYTLVAELYPTQYFDFEIR